MMKSAKRIIQLFLFVILMGQESVHHIQMNCSPQTPLTKMICVKNIMETSMFLMKWWTHVGCLNVALRRIIAQSLQNAGEVNKKLCCNKQQLKIMERFSEWIANLSDHQIFTLLTFKAYIYQLEKLGRIWQGHLIPNKRQLCMSVIAIRSSF